MAHRGVDDGTRVSHEGQRQQRDEGNEDEHPAAGARSPACDLVPITARSFHPWEIGSTPNFLDGPFAPGIHEAKHAHSN